MYQGNYNAFARKSEEELIPLLRKLNISFCAYSPIAGGFLAKTSKQISEGDSQRFSHDNPFAFIYRKMYVKDSLMNGLDQWDEIATNLNISKADLAYRWIAYHSALKKEFGDAFILGGRSLEQVAGTLNAISQGPLPEDAVAKIEKIWDSIKEDAPRDNYITMFSTTEK